MSTSHNRAASQANEPMRLQRFLARAGVSSRRRSEALILAGEVSVNGEAVSELGQKVQPLTDIVEVHGTRVELPNTAITLMLNKPAGYLTTMRDPQGRPCVASLVPHEAYPGLFPVGRLDRDTTGLLLFTTDGNLGQALLHPSHHVWKTYVATLAGNVAEKDLEPLRAGIELDDGPCLPARCRVLKYLPALGQTRVEIQICEGRKNQVKRMCSRVGHPVNTLHRSQFGPLELGSLAPSQWRELSDEELCALQPGERKAL